MYAMQVTDENAEFIGKYFNGGIQPGVIPGKKMFFVFGDEEDGRTMTLDDFVMKFDFTTVPHCALFKVL